MTKEEYVEKLRHYIKDHEHLNRLLKFEEENEDMDLELYIDMAINTINFIPPLIKTYKIKNFPFPAFLINQATIEVLISNGIVNSRNQLDYNNGGITVKVPNGDKYLNHLNILFRMNQQMTEQFKALKIKQNMEGAYGIIGSPYELLEHGLNQNKLL